MGERIERRGGNLAHRDGWAVTALHGRNCLITGASRGLGAAIAAAFWKAGANLLLVARSALALEAVAARLEARGQQQLHTLAADLAGPAAASTIVGQAQQAFTSLDVLVNNAGLQGPIGPAWENDWDEWLKALQVNLLSPVALCRACVPWMAGHGRGKIINLSGGGATGPRANFSAYAAAKAGLVRFSETLAAETAHFGIDVNCVAPGAMNTAMMAAVLAAGPEQAGQREYEVAVKARASGGASPEQAAALCVFLASSQSDGLTGKLISAVWDPWESLPEHLTELQQTDIYTLRRIVPRDRGKDWGDRA